MIIIETTHRRPTMPTRRRYWSANESGLFVPDIEMTEGGICVSRSTMDEIERQKAESERALGIIMIGASFCVYEAMPTSEGPDAHGPVHMRPMWHGSGWEERYYAERDRRVCADLARREAVQFEEQP